MNKLFLLSLIGKVALGGELDAQSCKSEVTFLAVGQPSAIKIKGKLGDVEKPLSGKVLLKDGGATGKLSLKLEALDTGIDVRNRHMKEKYLEVATYPTADLDFSCPAGKQELQGKLTLHGKTNPVKGTCTVKGESVSVDFKLKVQDYGIAIPSYMGITVTDEVSIQAKAEKAS